jgi:hypothetical protein
VRTAILIPLALVAACAHGADNRPRAEIGDHTSLILPTPPGYPETKTLVQSGRAHYGALSGAFDAVVDLSPERVQIVVTAAAGPRLATITWDQSGVDIDRTMLAPPGVPVENILSDMFISLWPPEAVTASLPRGVSLSLDEDGGRTLRRGDEVLTEVRPDPTDPSRAIVRNHAFGYEITVVSQPVS